MDLKASAMLPYDDAELARSVLRARLRDVVARRQVPEAALSGATMLIAGPAEITDATGRRWFEWVATLQCRPVGPPGSALSDDVDATPTVADLGLLRRRAG